MRTAMSTAWYPLALLGLLPLGCSGAPEDGDYVGTLHAALSTTAIYNLVGVNSGKCMDIQDGSTANGANVRIWTCNSATAQQFQFVDAGGGYYELRNVNSNKCVEISGAGTANGDNVIQYDCWGGNNQLWALNESNGVVNLVNKGSGKATDVYNWGTADGTNIVQWTNYNAANQQFTLSEVGSGGTNNPIPTNLSWTSSGILVSPQNSNYAAVKDPTIAYSGGKYHVYATVYNTQSTWQMVYFNFTDWSQAANAPQYEINQLSGFSGYNCAPQVFFFPPHNKWYLIYQSQQPRFSTVDNIDEPWNLTAPANMFTTTPSGMPSLPIDYYVICDDTNCHLFFTGDDGKLYRTQTTIGNFPHGWGNIEVELTYPTSVLFEGSSHYKIKDTNTYLTVAEGMGSNGRWFSAWEATNLAGPWTEFKTSESAPFAGYNNVSFPGGRWTNDISHGEMIRYQNDHHSILDPDNMQFLYQGRDPASGGAYELLPYHVGLLTATNATGGPPGGVSSPSSGSSVYLEAECTDTASGAYASTSTSKAGYSGDGHLMSVGNTTASSPDGASVDYATYDFNADAGTYTIYFRVDTDGDATNDSWFYRVNGGSWVLMNNTSATTTDWGWVAGTATVSLSGASTIEIANREDGLGIDKIAIVPSGSAAPSGLGGTANNCTGGSNVLVNPGFESGITGWTNWGGTLSADTATKRSGAAAGRLSGRTNTWQGPVQSLMGKVNGGQQYAARVYARVSAGSEPVSLVLQSTCGTTTNYTGVGSGTASSSSWVELTGTFSVPTCGDLQGLNLYVDGPAAGVDVYVDDAEVF